MNLFDLGAEPFDAAVCIYTFCKVCNLVADNALYGVLIDVGALGHGDECFAAVVRMMPRVKCKTVDDDLELTGMRLQKIGVSTITLLKDEMFFRMAMKFGSTLHWNLVYQCYG